MESNTIVATSADTSADTSTDTSTDTSADAQNDAQSSMPTDTSTDAQSDAQSDAQRVQDDAQLRALRISELTNVLKEYEMRDVAASFARSHFGNDVVSMLRKLLYAQSEETRGRVLFSRKFNADGSVVTYNLCGYVSRTVKQPNGQWKSEGFQMRAFDAQGRVTNEQLYSASGSAVDTEKTAARNGTAGWRLGVLRLIEDREIVASVTSAADNKMIAELQAQLKAAQAEVAKFAAIAQTASVNADLMKSVLARLDALGPASTDDTEGTEEVQTSA